MLYKELTIHIPSGLKSKGASMLTHVAGHFESQILIECENKKINAKSIMASSRSASRRAAPSPSSPTARTSRPPSTR